MSAEFLYQWPELPPLPPPGKPVIIRVRQASRAEARKVLRQALAKWSGMTPDILPIQDTMRGPEWNGLLAGEPLGISLSYCDGNAWIALVRGREIGIDAARIEFFDEMESVGRIYLGSKATKIIRDSATPERTFAFAWTNLEACMKCLKRDLVEWNDTHAALFKNLSHFEFLFENHTAVTMASRCGS